MEFLNRKSKLFLEKIRIFFKGVFLTTEERREGEEKEKREREKELK